MSLPITHAVSDACFVSQAIAQPSRVSAAYDAGASVYVWSSHFDDACGYFRFHDSSLWIDEMHLSDRSWPSSDFRAAAVPGTDSPRDQMHAGAGLNAIRYHRPKASDITRVAPLLVERLGPADRLFEVDCADGRDRLRVGYLLVRRDALIWSLAGARWQSVRPQGILHFSARSAPLRAQVSFVRVVQRRLAPVSPARHRHP
ncbi:MAG: hypothetical protein H6705_14790 [Myxococcales bacterium]|nr:hypothetical protein [Myxococcales bacterium]